MKSEGSVLLEENGVTLNQDNGSNKTKLSDRLATADDRDHVPHPIAAEVAERQYLLHRL